VKHGILTTAVVLSFLAGPPASAGDDIVLKPDSDVRIIEIGPFENAQFWLRELLAKYVLKALGKEDCSGSGSRVTFLIEARAADWSDIPRSEINDIADIDAFEIEVLPGPDGVVHITGATVLATGFGVMHFLEEYMGIMWLFPGELGLHVPDREEFRLPASKERVRPFFASRLCTGFVYRNKSIPARRFIYDGLIHRESMFFYGHDYFKSLKLHHLASPSHNMINIFPLSTREEHPDLLPMVEGKRWVPPDKDSPKGRVGYWQAWHPCYTKAKTVEIAVAKASQAFEDGAYCFSLGINDGHRIQCECPDCTRVGWPRSYYEFVAKVADQVRDHYPPHLIGVIAYGDVTYPPENLQLPENVLVMCVSGGPERHHRWSKHAEVLGTYEWGHGQGYWIPNFPLAGLKGNARFYRDHGIRFFRSEVHPLWAFDGPKVYLYLRMLWNPELDMDATLRRYCDAAYGAGGGEMYDLWKYWADKRPDTMNGGVTPMHASSEAGRFWRDPAKQFENTRAEDFGYSLSRIAKAKAAVTGELPRRRIEMVGTFFEDSHTLFAMKELREKALDPSSGRDWPKAVREALRLQRHRRELLAVMRDHPEWFQGTSATVDENLQPSWEERGVMVYPREMRNIIRTAAVELNRTPEDASLELPDEFSIYLHPYESHTLRHYARPKHPWYRETRYAPLEITETKEAILFRAGRTDLRITEHPTLKGQRKGHWHAGFVLKIPFSRKNLYLFDFDARGRNGVLDLRVHSGSNNTGRNETGIIETFGPEGGHVRRRVALLGAVIDRKTLEPLAVQPRDAQGMFNVYLTWKPSTDESPLEGSWRMTRLKFGDDGS